MSAEIFLEHLRKNTDVNFFIIYLLSTPIYNEVKIHRLGIYLYVLEIFIYYPLLYIINTQAWLAFIKLKFLKYLQLLIVSGGCRTV